MGELVRQTKYIEKLATEFFPGGVPPTAQANKVPCDRELPALVHLALLDDAAPDPQLLRRYQSICGALLYASTNTRPDIASSHFNFTRLQKWRFCLHCLSSEEDNLHIHQQMCILHLEIQQ